MSYGIHNTSTRLLCHVLFQYLSEPDQILIGSTHGGIGFFLLEGLGSFAGVKVSLYFEDWAVLVRRNRSDSASSCNAWCAVFFCVMLRSDERPARQVTVNSHTPHLERSPTRGCLQATVGCMSGVQAVFALLKRSCLHLSSSNHVSFVRSSKSSQVEWP